MNRNVSEMEKLEVMQHNRKVRMNNMINQVKVNNYLSMNNQERFKNVCLGYSIQAERLLKKLQEYTAGDTGAIKDSMDITQEELKYMRDIAERDIIDKYTLAEVHIEQNNTNNINSGDDIDGFMTKLTDSVNEAVDNMTEGVHD